MRMENRIKIGVFHENKTGRLLEALKRNGIDVSKCYICGAPIVATERPPRKWVLWEWWDAIIHKRKFYDWNVGGISDKGVICDKIKCFVDALYEQYEDE